MSSSSKQLSIIGGNISSLNSLKINADLQSLNLHSNHLLDLSHGVLCQFKYLRHLDLSSNSLRSCLGLEGLYCLRTLDLSSNQLTALTSLGDLNNLCKLTVSYNRIRDVSGMKNNLHSLQNFSIQGNLVKDLHMFIDNVSHIRSLQHLIVSEGKYSNPMCFDENYGLKIWKRLECLKSLNGADRFGNPIENEDDIIPELDDYMQYLSPNIYEDSIEPDIISVTTPSTESGISPTSTLYTGSLNDNENRIKLLEEQISILLSQKVDRPSKEQSIQSSNSKKDVKSKTPKVALIPTTNALVLDLEKQRERAWKSEKRNLELVDRLKQLESSLEHQKKLQEEALTGINSMKSSLSREREINEKKSLIINQAKRLIVDKCNEIEHLQNSEKEFKNSFLTLQSTYKRMTEERSVLQNENSKLLEQISSLQNTIREKDSRIQNHCSNRFSLDSSEVQTLITKELAKEKALFEKDREFLNHKIDDEKNRYVELENEFRSALYFEEGRFMSMQKEMQACNQKISDLSNKQQHFIEKDKRNADVIAEMSQVINEQKGRISELLKFKKEGDQQAIDRIAILEKQLREASSINEKVEVLTNDKTRLAAHIQAQDSIIAGLRKERKLWEVELANQGAGLAAERGRLEVQNEILRTESLKLKQSSEQDADALRIKSKLIEDQIDTVRRLKLSVQERDEALKTLQENAKKSERDFEIKVKDDEQIRADIENQLIEALAEKDDLKDQIEALSAELCAEREEHDSLRNRWQQKSALITQLEIQVKQMKSNWDNKEAQLIKEKEQAAKDALLALNKLSSVESSFNEKLKKEEKHWEEMFRKLEADKLCAVQQAQNETLTVEAEMRELLREHEKNKAEFASRAAKLNNALSELQAGFS